MLAQHIFTQVLHIVPLLDNLLLLESADYVKCGLELLTARVALLVLDATSKMRSSHRVLRLDCFGCNELALIAHELICICIVVVLHYLAHPQTVVTG